MKSDLRGYATMLGGSLLLVVMLLMLEDTTPSDDEATPEVPKTALELEQEKLAQARERKTKVHREPETDEDRMRREEARLKQAELDRAHEAARLEFEQDEEELAAARRELALAKSRREDDERIRETKEVLEQLIAERQAEVDELERKAAAAHEAMRQSELRQRRMEAQFREIERKRSYGGSLVGKIQARNAEEKTAQGEVDQEATDRYFETKRQLEEEREERVRKRRSGEPAPVQ